MERSLCSDRIQTAKVGITINKPFDHDLCTHNLTVKASSEVSSDYLNTSFVKTKLFVRYMRAFRSI